MNPNHILNATGDGPLITDALLAKVFAPVIREIMAEDYESGFDFGDWLSLIKWDIARLPNRLPPEAEGGDPLDRLRELWAMLDPHDRAEFLEEAHHAPEAARREVEQ